MAKKFTMPAGCESEMEDRLPFVVNENSIWLILNDIHIPYHDAQACEMAITEGLLAGATGVLLNGDVMDAISISKHVQHKDTPDYHEEIAKTLVFLRALRKSFPKQRILYKSGNHEERLEAYIYTHAPQMANLKGLDLASFLEFKELGIEWINDKRTIKLGKINIHHGHEFNGGGGENIGTWLFKKCGGGTVDACGHFHKTDFFGKRNSNDFIAAAWSMGCLCGLQPFWCKNNQWNHGFGLCELAKGGDFRFHNRRIHNGTVFS